MARLKSPVPSMGDVDRVLLVAPLPRESLQGRDIIRSFLSCIAQKSDADMPDYDNIYLCFSDKKYVYGLFKEEFPSLHVGEWMLTYEY